MQTFNPKTDPKWCPMIQVLQLQDGTITTNRDLSTSQDLCIGAKCACWVVDSTWNNNKGYCGLIGGK